MIHRALLGSIERFMAVLIEHYAGEFPFWLMPVQIEILPVLEKHLDYAKSISEKLKELNYRVEIDFNDETLSKRIRNAELNKIPYILVVGDKEISSNTVAVRKRGRGDLGAYSLDKLINDLLQNEK